MRVGIVLQALALIPSLAGAQGARIEQSDSGPRVVASATRTARVAADRVSVLANVEGTAESAGEAVQRGERKVQAVMEAIRQAGVQAQAAAVPYGITPVATGLNPYQPPAGPASYTARFVVRVQSARVDQVAGLAAAMVAAGATTAASSLFEASAADSVRRTLYAEALTEARHDAEALAAALGGRLGPLLEASSGAPPTPVIGANYVNFAANIGAPSPAPDVVVSATASVRYRFVPR